MTLLKPRRTNLSFSDTGLAGRASTSSLIGRLGEDWNKAATLVDLVVASASAKLPRSIDARIVRDYELGRYTPRVALGVQ